MKRQLLILGALLLLLTGCIPEDPKNDQNTTANNNEINVPVANQAGQTHNQGLACITCHGTNADNAAAKAARTFNLGGTLFSEQNASDSTLGADLSHFFVAFVKVDQNHTFVQGKGQGNFFSQTTITGDDYEARIYDENKTLRLSSSATHGENRMNCNNCHTQNGNGATSGRVYTKAIIQTAPSFVVDTPSANHAGVSHYQGQNCLECHNVGGGNPKQFVLGGSLLTTLDTVDFKLGYNVNDYNITLVHANDANASIQLVAGNGQGNFYSSNTPVDDNYSVKIRTSAGVLISSSHSNHGVSRQQCNKCHTAAGNTNVPGRIFLPLFESVVYASFSKCVDCHPDAGRLDVSTAANAHNSITTYNLHDTTTPSDSTLLKKASGTVSHGGGTQLSTTSVEYKTIKEWMLNGALDN